MKSFSQFLSESITQAARQAKRLGLKGDGHGGWVDPSGKVVARTVDGKLVFTSGRRPSSGTDPDKPGAAARQALPAEPPAGVDQGAQQDQPETEPEQEVEKTRGTVTLGFGRFNPPTAGHKNFLTPLKILLRVSSIMFIRPILRTQRKIPWTLKQKFSS
jgi:hypothetical protein